MPRDAERTRGRFLAAATKEFAERGIAGARVDRIAAMAGASKALIYSYFGNKEQLFDAVFDAVVAGVVETVPIDAGDLPGYAVRLYDLYQAKPEILRLATWRTLERGASEPPQRAAEAGREKLAAIEAAQRAGSITSRFEAGELLALVLGLALTGIVEGAIDPADSASIARRRQSIATAAALLAAP